jgi:hypothetical protein
LVCQRKHFARVLILQKKALFPFGVGALAYNLFHTLHLIISNAQEEQENYWVKLNKEMLTYFWKEFEDNGKHKLHCIGELALLVIHVFGRMLLTVGLKHTQKMFNLLGMPYDVEEQKVSILSSIVNQSYLIMKKRCISHDYYHVDRSQSYL